MCGKSWLHIVVAWRLPFAEELEAAIYGARRWISLIQIGEMAMIFPRRAITGVWNALYSGATGRSRGYQASLTDPGGRSPFNNATTSDCRLYPVLANTALTWVRTVLADVPLSAAMTFTVWPAARPRATRASAGVKSKSDRISSTDGASGLVTGVNINIAAQ